MSVTQTLTNTWLRSRHALVAAAGGVLFGFLNGLVVFLQPQPLAGVLLQDIPKALRCGSEEVFLIESETQSCYMIAIAEPDVEQQEPAVSSSSSNSSASPVRVIVRPATPVEAPVVHTAAPEQVATPAPVTEEPVETPTDVSGFPAFGRALYPVGRIPNWGAMKSSAEWNRTYADMPQEAYVSLPSYDMSVLTQPLKEIMADRDSDESIKALTTKLFYSTRFFGSYDPDSGEFSGKHAGIDFKLPLGTPIRSIGGGIVHDVRSTPELGTHVIVEHRVDGQTYYAVYGHLAAASVEPGARIQPGTTIGTVGMTGSTAAPHLHLQIDRGEPGEEAHMPYMPASTPSRSDALSRTVHPISFIASHR